MAPEEDMGSYLDEYHADGLKDALLDAEGADVTIVKTEDNAGDCGDFNFLELYQA